VSQVGVAEPRDIKPIIGLNERLVFMPNEVETVASSMRVFVEKLSDSLAKDSGQKDRRF